MAGRKLLFYVAIATQTLSLSLGVAAQSPAAQISDAEKRFAQSAQEGGIRAAFLAFLADDAVMFNPAPVNGKELWTKRTESGASLTWQPTFAACARSGDFGYDTGPWEWKKAASEAKPSAWGQFVSVWKKQADGTWKVAVDFGNDNPRPTDDSAAKPTLSFGETPAEAKVDGKTARRALEDAQHRFAEKAKVDSTDALLDCANEEVRILRQSALPAIGREAAGVMLSVQRGKMTIAPLGSGISQSTDMAYSFGTYSVNRGVNTERGHYLQIWQMDAKGSWKIALDLEKKLASNEKQPGA